MSSAVRYRVEGKIADGGMAEIFLARQIGAEGFEKQVVLKRIRPAFAADSTFVRMFLDEAHIASTLSHSNIVQVLDLGSANDRYFLALEFIDGWDLHEISRRGVEINKPLPMELSLYVVSCLLRALHFAHTRESRGKPMKIVHRDCSPQNVLVSREGEVKLADFGIAKAVDRRERSVSGLIKGKVGFLSPEQSLGNEIDGRSDVFSVGTVLYVLTVGRHPFDAANDVEVIFNIREGRYPPPSLIVEGFDSRVEELISKALAVEVEKRWQSAEAMGIAIDQLLSEMPGMVGPRALKRYVASLNLDGAFPPTGQRTRAESESDPEIVLSDIDLESVRPMWAADTIAPWEAEEPPQLPSSKPPTLPADVEQPGADDEQTGDSQASPAQLPSGATAVVRPRRGVSVFALGLGFVALCAVLVAAWAVSPERLPWLDAVLEPILGSRASVDGAIGSTASSSDPGRPIDGQGLITMPDSVTGDAEVKADAAAITAEDAAAEAGRVTDGSPAPGGDGGAVTGTTITELAMADAAAADAGDAGTGEPRESEDSLVPRILADLEDVVVGRDESEPDADAATTTPTPDEATPGPVRVSITSVPKGAIVRSKRKVFGRTPITLKFAPKLTYKLWLVKKGWVTTTRTFKARSVPKQKLHVAMRRVPKKVVKKGPKGKGRKGR